jgi:hypothetical protein
MVIPISIAVSIIAVLALAYCIAKSSKQEIDAHEEMTLTDEVNYENRSYYDF